MSRARPWLRASWLAAAWLPLLALIALPLAIFVAYSFFRVEGSAIVHEPGLGNYARFFGEGVFLPVFARTCLLALEVAAITLLIGYPLAIWLLGDRVDLCVLVALRNENPDEQQHTKTDDHADERWRHDQTLGHSPRPAG